MTTINKAIEAGSIDFLTHSNSPYLQILDIVKTTEKAIQVKEEFGDRLVWIPKSALKPVPNRTETFTLKDWFRRSLWANNQIATLQALNLHA